MNKKKRKADAAIIFSHIKVQNANAVSGPITWGFPAPSAILGVVHALNRSLSEESNFELGGVGIVCHDFKPQITKPSGKSYNVFNLTRNPLDKKGDTCAIIEDGRAHLEISLVIAVHFKNDLLIEEDKGQEIAKCLCDKLETMRIAGGSILSIKSNPQCFILSPYEETRIEQFKSIRRKLLPGFVLIQREDILLEHFDEIKKENGALTLLDALLDLSRIDYVAEQNLTNIEDLDSDNEDEQDEDLETSIEDEQGEYLDKNNKKNRGEKGTVKWVMKNKPDGWLVPIPIGYGSISPLYKAGDVKNARDFINDFGFVESLYSLGEWRGPHRIEKIDDLFWNYDFDSELGLYLCSNKNRFGEKGDH